MRRSEQRPKPPGSAQPYRQQWVQIEKDAEVQTSMINAWKRTRTLFLFTEFCKYDWILLESIRFSFFLPVVTNVLWDPPLALFTSFGEHWHSHPLSLAKKVCFAGFGCRKRWKTQRENDGAQHEEWSLHRGEGPPKMTVHDAPVILEIKHRLL